MAENLKDILFERNTIGEIDDSELIETYDRNYEKVKKKHIKKLHPIDDSNDELNSNVRDSEETNVKNKSKKKIINTNPIYQEPSNVYEDALDNFPPPPPPDSVKNLPKTEREAQTSMLMSYYMSGFHTGYYLGMKQNNSNK